MNDANESAGASEGRAALESLRLGLSVLFDLAERLDAVEGERERQNVLLVLTRQAGDVQERAAQAYAAVERARDEDGFGRGLLG
jgi:hypothetical protein